MTGSVADISGRTAARVAGLALLAMTALAVFANFFVYESLVVVGDAAETARRIAESTAMFRAGIVAWVLIGVLDVVIALALVRVAQHRVHLVAREVNIDAHYARLEPRLDAVVDGVFEQRLQD